MTRATIPVIVLLLFASSSASYAQTYCGKSWYEGSDRIRPLNRVVRIDRSRLQTRIRIRGTNGQYFLLTLAAGLAGGKNRIVEVIAFLESTKERDVDLLAPARDDLQDYFDFRGRPGWFYIAGKDPEASDEPKSVLPFLTKRVVKIGDFYCILSVGRFNFDGLDKGAFEFVNVRVEFRNAYAECESA